jgi:hypothetical protein
MERTVASINPGALSTELLIEATHGCADVLTQRLVLDNGKERDKYLIQSR